MKIRDLLFVTALAAPAAGCVTASGLYSNCDTGGDFGKVWSCTRAATVAKAAPNRYKTTYIAAGDAIQEKWKQGAITDAEAKLLLVSVASNIDAEIDRNRAAASAQLGASLQAASAAMQRQQMIDAMNRPVNVNITTTAPAAAPTPHIWRPAGYQHLNY
ncbi:hypothetical protein ACFFJ7_05730 [Pseudochelatococcus lubricantis]|uniref:hypothetical protein n=1 Tax=Pseudochelatococcus lubricantis TaxID=1538102 RepID=UPI0035ED2B87